MTLELLSLSKPWPKPVMLPDFPVMRCAECGRFLQPEGLLDSSLNSIRLRHPDMPEFLLDLDAPADFCPHNGKVWNMSWPDGIITQVAP